MKAIPVHFEGPGWLFWNPDALATIRLEDTPEVNRETVEEYIRQYQHIGEGPPIGQDIVDILNQPHGAILLPTSTSRKTAEFVARMIQDIVGDSK